MAAHRHLAATAATAMLVMAANSSQAEIVELTWSAAGHFEHTSPVAPGKFVELCGKLTAGQQVRWRFTSSAPSDFNIHYHLSKSEVVYPARAKAVKQGQDTLRVALEQDYCWMWSNRGEQPLRLNVQLERVAP